VLSSWVIHSRWISHNVMFIRRKEGTGRGPRRVLNGARNHTLAYSWGNLGCDTDQDLVAAIVVDTTRNDSSQFGLVIFGKPTASTYRPIDSFGIVIFENGCLSGQWLPGVTTYHDDGKYHNCWIEWRGKSTLSANDALT